MLLNNDSKGVNIKTRASLTLYCIQALTCMLPCMFELGPNSLWHTRIILNSFMLKTPSQNFYAYCVPKRLVDQHNGLGERHGLDGLIIFLCVNILKICLKNKVLDKFIISQTYRILTSSQRAN